MIRRNIDAVVMQIRREISEACSKIADERGKIAARDDWRQSVHPPERFGGVDTSL